MDYQDFKAWFHDQYGQHIGIESVRRCWEQRMWRAHCLDGEQKPKQSIGESSLQPDSETA